MWRGGGGGRFGFLESSVGVVSLASPFVRVVGEGGLRSQNPKPPNPKP